jgi:hypothetical protein
VNAVGLQIVDGETQPGAEGEAMIVDPLRHFVAGDRAIECSAIE